MRLDKFLAETTGMSRKEAMRTLHAGAVSVDGVVAKKGAMQVPATAEVIFNGVTLKLLGPTYIMLHKPLDCVCANDDPRHMTVFAYLDLPNPEKFHTVGRLDIDTSGLLLITNDGQWTHRIISPKRSCPKVYRAELAEPLEPHHVELFKQGLQLHGEKKLTEPAQLDIIHPQQALVTLSEGRYHQVRRMFAAIGNRVESLHREQIGELKLGDLGPGEYRHLTAAEVALF
ncbi:MULTISPECIES: 16S rRNA pseudouridine(516) synthase RsuA [Pseudidiomarina]|uniref:Pseudouridine synthase n=3 Tax=Pseudidiomarina TaxID=2800384 RepID=A0A368V4D8_9GAMM|nr:MULTISPECIES: 16S rRNA pseudouridine(516) synthase RsuA [Pseudidiomarina]PWW15991.1 ribosomal small subunit pseudouridine synthase A [Pseudidiomarina maritima]RBP93499.1 ribosomal small subunit pseudouridine synthase A [Pseudidiomarina tainanensis]RCW35959.1 ribosomal small subunit pseudouridine synthase A [Pseudidiomarina tainanensis]